ncbi:hypothetical protein [Streptomyces sp. TRM49041]|uniref:hypothetical protein n=1 Tax=Streptomyces sp. TRM49041 TaxID=2603216 RepID=UPI0011EF54B2|nr:hypothetical protein [Streptomyces sp. TRM49041]
MEQQVECGTLVYDPVADKVGEYRAVSGPYVLLRPLGGGREWEADPVRIRPASLAERLSAGVRAANGRTATGAAASLDRPPAPVPGCAACLELAALRADARNRHDGSAATDASVLLRRHLAERHAG